MNNEDFFWCSVLLAPVIVPVIITSLVAIFNKLTR